MDNIEIKCDVCGRVRADIIEVRDSDDAFKEVVCVCPICKTKHIVPINQ